MTNPYLDDKRLLEALDFIDERFIAEVTEDYEIFDLPGEYKPNRKRTFRAYRQFIALAACLILLSGAFPVVNYAVKVINSFAAGWGSGTTEENSLELDSTEIDSPYERAIDAYPEGMSAEEIYVDVLKGGWAVIADTDNSSFIAGGDLWYTFFEKTQKGEYATVLLAEYFSNIHRDDDKTVIFLKEIVYDGDIFHFRIFSSTTDEVIWHEEYKFLKTGKSEHLLNGETVFEEAFFLTNSDTVTWGDLRGHFWSAMYAPEIELFNEYNYLIIHFY